MNGYQGPGGKIWKFSFNPALTVYVGWLDSGACWGLTPFADWVISGHRLSQPAPQTLREISYMATWSARSCIIRYTKRDGEPVLTAPSCTLCSEEPSKSHQGCVWQLPRWCSNNNNKRVKVSRRFDIRWIFGFHLPRNRLNQHNCTSLRL